MDFHDILACLEDPERRDEYIARLKSAGETSQPVLDLKNSMEGLKMNKPPKHIFETTMLQHTFKYCDPLECFLQFRLVCKPWKNAVETIKFDEFHEPDIEENANHTAFISKFLPMFKKISLDVCDRVFQSEQIRKLLLRDISHLNRITIIAPFTDQMETEYAEAFIKQLYQNSINTLKVICHNGKFLPNLKFPNVTKVDLLLSPGQIKTIFVPTLKQVLKNMENIKVIDIDTNEQHESVCDFIARNYSQHCISSVYATMLNFFPVKICLGMFLDDVQNKKYNFGIEYLGGLIPMLMDPTCGNWDQYEEILDQLTNLKQIAFFDEESNDVQLDENDIPKTWHDMLSYLKKRGIEIVSERKINNQDLFDKVAKDVGVRWGFKFY